MPATVATHSPQAEPLREELLAALEWISPRSGDVPFFSTVTGGFLDTAELGAEYWYRNMREPVQLERATRSLLEEGHRSFIEVSPHPVLTFGVQETVERALEPGEGVVVGSLRREQAGVERFVRSLAEVWVCGVEVDWRAVCGGVGARRVALPTYPFQRRRYWLAPKVGVGDVSGAGLGVSDHPLLGAAVQVAGGEGWLFTGRLSLDTHAWIADHAALGAVLLPGTGFLELVLAAGREVGCEAVEELTLEVPLVLVPGTAVRLQVSLGEPDGDGRREVSVYSVRRRRRRMPMGRSSRRVVAGYGTRAVRCCQNWMWLWTHRDWGRSGRRRAPRSWMSSSSTTGWRRPGTAMARCSRASRRRGTETGRFTPRWLSGRRRRRGR